MDCKRLPTIPQIKDTCWFNTILMVLFYSDMMKRITLEKSEKWKNRTGLRKIFLEIITHQKFDYDIPTYILKELHKENKDIFEFDPDKSRGYHSYKYIGKILDYLNVNSYIVAYNFINYIKINNFKKKKVYNNNFYIETGKNIIENPDILILNMNVSSSEIINLNREYNFEIVGLKKPKDSIVYNKKKYKLDSCIFRNYNKVNHINHVIAGVTCNNSRYIYNGWINPNTKSPCSLIPYDWQNEKGDFCLDTKNCKLSDTYDSEYPYYCFNLKKYDTQKTYIYVKESIPEIVVEKTNGETILKSAKHPLKKCPSTMILNPKTNRCVKISGKIGKKLIENNK